MSFNEVEKVIIYGSRAIGNYREYSDIDLTFFGAKLDLKTLNQISTHLDELNLIYKFDLSILSHISNASLLEHISRVGIVFYKK